MRLTIGRKLVPAFLAMAVLLLLVSVVGFLSLGGISRSADEVAVITGEHDLLLELQLALAKALTPASKYLITGDPFEWENLASHFRVVEARLGEVRPEQVMLADLPSRLADVKSLGVRILAIPDPVGNREGMTLMAEMDRAAHVLISDMDRLHETHKQAVAATITAQVAIREQATRLLAGAGLLATAAAVAFGLLLSRSIARPITALQRGAEIIGAGDLNFRMDIQTGDEIGQLAAAFNTMAERLRESYATLEERVNVRTRELAEANRELQASHRVRQELLARVISVQEEERRRIARGLHDETGQAIASLALSLDFLRTTAGDVRLQERLERLHAVARATLEEIHKVIFDLRPRVLDDLGLAPAVAGYLDSHLRALGIEATLEAHGLEARLPAEIETAVFRIIQEGITNVVKHAGARRVRVCIDFSGSLLVMFIEDDGAGFDPQAVLTTSDVRHGLGLLGIRERVAYLHGTLNIHSRPGEGTRLYVEMPMEVSWNASESSSQMTTPFSEKASV